MEIKLSIKKTPEISFSFDNQKKDPNTKEGSKLQAKASLKCNLIKKLAVKPMSHKPQTIIMEIEIARLPVFTRQMRTSAAVKKPKWTTVENTEGNVKFNVVEECGFTIPTSTDKNVINAYISKVRY